MNQLGDSKQIIKREARVGGRKREAEGRTAVGREGAECTRRRRARKLRRLLQSDQRGEERTAEREFHGRLWCKSERTLAAEMQSRARAMGAVEDGQGG